MHKVLKYIVVSILFFAGFSLTSKAQFKEDAFSQTYNESLNGE